MLVSISSSFYAIVNLECVLIMLDYPGSILSFDFQEKAAGVPRIIFMTILL